MQGEDCDIRVKALKGMELLYYGNLFMRACQFPAHHLRWKSVVCSSVSYTLESLNTEIYGCTVCCKLKIHAHSDVPALPFLMKLYDKLCCLSSIFIVHIYSSSNTEHMIHVHPWCVIQHCGLINEEMLFSIFCATLLYVLCCFRVYIFY